MNHTKRNQYVKDQKTTNNSQNRLNDEFLSQDIEKISSNLDQNTEQINSLINIIPNDILLQVLPDFLSNNELNQTNNSPNSKLPNKIDKDQINLISTAINNITILINLLKKVLPPEILAEMPDFDLISNPVHTNNSNESQIKQSINYTEIKSSEIQTKTNKTESKSKQKENNPNLTLRPKSQREIIFYPSNDIYPKEQEFENQNKKLIYTLKNKQNSIKNPKTKNFTISFHQKIQFLNFSNKRLPTNSNNMRSRFTLVTSVASESAINSVETVNFSNFTFSKIFLIANIYPFNFSKENRAIENLPYQLSGIIGRVDIFENERRNIYTEINNKYINVHLIKNKIEEEEDKTAKIKSSLINEAEDLEEEEKHEITFVTRNIEEKIENNVIEENQITIENENLNQINTDYLIENIEEEEVNDDFQLDSSSEQNHNQKEEIIYNDHIEIIEEEESNETETNNNNNEEEEEKASNKQVEIIEEEESTEIVNKIEINNNEEEEKPSNTHEEESNEIVKNIEIISHKEEISNNGVTILSSNEGEENLEKAEIIKENNDNSNVIERHAKIQSENLVVSESNTNPVVEKHHEHRHHRKSSDFTSSDGRSVRHHRRRSNAGSSDGDQEHRHLTSENEKEEEVTDRRLALVTLNDNNEEEIEHNHEISQIENYQIVKNINDGKNITTSVSYNSQKQYLHNNNTEINNFITTSEIHEHHQIIQNNGEINELDRNNINQYLIDNQRKSIVNRSYSTTNKVSEIVELEIEGYDGEVDQKFIQKIMQHPEFEGIDESQLSIEVKENKNIVVRATKESQEHHHFNDNFEEINQIEEMKENDIKQICFNNNQPKSLQNVSFSTNEEEQDFETNEIEILNGDNKDVEFINQLLNRSEIKNANKSQLFIEMKQTTNYSTSRVQKTISKTKNHK